MENSRRVTIEMLEDIFSLIIKKLKDEEFLQISIEQDLYQIIPTDEWGKFDKEVIVTGSLYDDFDSLKRVLEDKEKPFTYVDFDRTASILRSISETLSPVNG